jgi:hypothetical protein
MISRIIFVQVFRYFIDLKGLTLIAVMIDEIIPHSQLHLPEMILFIIGGVVANLTLKSHQVGALVVKPTKFSLNFVASVRKIDLNT